MMCTSLYQRLKLASYLTTLGFSVFCGKPVSAQIKASDLNGTWLQISRESAGTVNHSENTTSITLITFSTVGEAQTYTLATQPGGSDCLVVIRGPYQLSATPGTDGAILKVLGWDQYVRGQCSSTGEDRSPYSETVTHRVTVGSSNISLNGKDELRRTSADPDPPFIVRYLRLAPEEIAVMNRRLGIASALQRLDVPFTVPNRPDVGSTINGGDPGSGPLTEASKQTVSLQTTLESDQATAARIDQEIQDTQATPCYGSGVAATICNTTKGVNLGRLQTQANAAHAQVDQDQQTIQGYQSQAPNSAAPTDTSNPASAIGNYGVPATGSTSASADSPQPVGGQGYTEGLPQCPRTEYNGAALFIQNDCYLDIVVSFTSDSGNTWGQSMIGRNGRTQLTAFGMGYDPKRDGKVYLFACAKGSQPVMPDGSLWIPHDYHGQYRCHQ